MHGSSDVRFSPAHKTGEAAPVRPPAFDEEDIMSKGPTVHFEGKDMPMSEWLELVSLRDAARRDWSGMSDDALMAIEPTDEIEAHAIAAELRRRAEAQFREADRLERWGRLSPDVYDRSE
jgi:hypothetical protein